MPDQDVLLTASGIGKRFGALVVLSDVDFAVRAREAIGIVGPNGAGKTTLLNVLSGALRPDAGRIVFRGARRDARWTRPSAAGAASRASHQIPRPFAGMTVFENCWSARAPAAGCARRGGVSARASRPRPLRHAAARQPARGDAGPARPQAAGTGARAGDRPGAAAARRDRRRADRRRGGGAGRHHPRHLRRAASRSSGSSTSCTCWCRWSGGWCAWTPAASSPTARRDAVLQDAAVIDAYLGIGRMPILSVDALDARHGLLQAVRGVSLAVEEGETLALVGANGAGKTTLLRCIAGAHRASGGRVLFDGADMTQRAGAPARAAGHRAGAGGAAAVRRHDGGGEPARRRAAAAGAGPGRVERVLDAFPQLGPKLQRARRRSLGRRAAGDGDRARADDQSARCCCWTRCRSACRRSRSMRVYASLQRPARRRHHGRAGRAGPGARAARRRPRGVHAGGAGGRRGPRAPRRRASR